LKRTCPLGQTKLEATDSTVLSPLRKTGTAWERERRVVEATKRSDLRATIVYKKGFGWMV
jgi:hypothetical protein